MVPIDRGLLPDLEDRMIPQLGEPGVPVDVEVVDSVIAAEPVEVSTTCLLDWIPIYEPS